LRSIESRIIGTRISKENEVMVRTSAAKTIAGLPDSVLKTELADTTAKPVMIQPSTNVTEKPEECIKPLSTVFEPD
jgi:hypothetical protein